MAGVSGRARNEISAAGIPKISAFYSRKGNSSNGEKIIKGYETFTLKDANIMCFIFFYYIKNYIFI